MSQKIPETSQSPSWYHTPLPKLPIPSTLLSTYSLPPSFMGAYLSPFTCHSPLSLFITPITIFLLPFSSSPPSAVFLRLTLIAFVPYTYITLPSTSVHHSLDSLPPSPLLLFTSMCLSFPIPQVSTFWYLLSRFSLPLSLLYTLSFTLTSISFPPFPLVATLLHSHVSLSSPSQVVTTASHRCRKAQRMIRFVLFPIHDAGFVSSPK